jgi:DNA recombination protein RmuC
MAQLDSLLSPLRERIGEFERTVRDVYSVEARERFHLQKEVERLSQASLRVGDDARSLAEALRGNSKIRGNWGESTLLRLLEASGLRPDTDYRLQTAFATPNSPDQTRLIPDVLILLPEDKHLVIDAKVSLIAYERYLQAETDALRQQALREHADAVQRHIKELGSKHYHQLQGLSSPDLVLLFMPIEDALMVALQARPELMAFAWERKVVPVAATSLFATLQTVASVWRLAQQSRNAQEIARQGGILYDKFADFVTALDKLGKSLATASQVYDDTLNRLRDGRESLMKQAHKLREMGAPATKRLPEGE